VRDVIGRVDDHNRALLDIEVRRTPSDRDTTVTVWIDTAFDGHLVFPRSLIDVLQLESLVETEAILADGSRIALETFLAYVHWFGLVIPIQVIANEGKLPLLGTGLLDSRVLHVDYQAKSLTIH
jgi:clan AA aspartic protease